MSSATNDPAACQALWQAVAPIFSDDNGSLPELTIDGLDGRDVEKTFECLRRNERRAFPESQYIWMKDPGEEVPLARLARPAAAVVAGTGEAFHCTLVDVAPHGGRLPELGVFVFPDRIEIDYRKGPEWNAFTVAALLDWLVECAPVEATFEVWDAWPDDVRAVAQAGVDTYVRHVRTSRGGRVLRRLAAIPPLDAMLAEHVGYYGEVLPYLFLGDVTRWLVAHAENPAPGERAAARQVVEVLDEEYATGDDEARNLVGAGVLEDLPMFDSGHPVWALLTERLVEAPRGVSETRPRYLTASGVDPRVFVRALVDAALPAVDRCASAVALRGASDDEAYHALVAVAADAAAPREVAEEAGRSVAHVARRMARVFDVPWGTFTDDASAAFDLEVARLQGDV